ncbi:MULTISPECIES: membrane protein insertase YidC [Fictibacillus]|uniref:Membrane protein insertase YidC n=1 Tax=Fictibacillus enclensis TaxID=1017270 RepID=A0A0V8JCK0_9BACL|nr:MULTISPECIES: membrane protein insertase YidC [Fictibacillus]KSU84739.1 hypothetical protein AS030_04185 [Fictibacillus enclensis]RXY99611.1 membrane protein insertase YidC [Fictibacillus sp. S7]SCB84728.1 YidC/Oxa1 family membrane protein insertase [Fictibacillus enclensis]
MKQKKQRSGLSHGLKFLIAILGIWVLAGCSRAPVNAQSHGVWSHYFVYPFSEVIQFVATFFNGNYGLAIIFLTIIIRCLLLPFTISQTKNQQKMKELQPEMKRIREKYKGKDKETQVKMQQEVMALYQKHGVNPVSMGCMPLLIQMPILLAFYYAIIRTKEIAAHNFLWFNLGTPDPTHILPIIAAITTFIQYKIINRQLEQVNPQIQMMGYIMPMIIVFSAWKLSAVLPLYWIVGNIFMTVQSIVLNRKRKNMQTAANPNS